MEQFWLSHRVTILSWSFLGAFLALGMAEIFRPRRSPQSSIPRRWLCNLLIAGLNTGIGVLLLRTGTVAVAATVASWHRSFRLSELPLLAAIPLTFLFMDLVRYAQHRLYHSIPLLWRIHKLHHDDGDFDLTTGVRFHPFEAALTLGSDLLCVLLLAPPVAGVLALELITTLQDLFEHANIRLPGAADRVVRALLITPDMHRVHHSANVPEQNRNFGVIFPWWDRVFGTYQPQPEGGHEAMRLGID